MTPDPAAGGPPQVSVVVVNWNAGDVLVNCLRSLAANPPSVSWEAIVVDNASTDDSLDRVRAELPWARVIVNSRNRGLAGANNQGIAASQAPYVLLSNPDVEYQPGCVDALRDLLRRRERAALAVARLVYPDGRPQTCAGDLPTLAEVLAGRSLGRRLGARAGRDGGGFWWYGWAHDEERPIGHGMEACYMARRAAIEQFGLQDERFPLDWEGIEWSARAQDAGWEVWFSPDAVATHIGGVTISQVPYRWIVSSHLGMYRYFRTRLPAAARPLLACAFLVRAAAKLVGRAGRLRRYERTRWPAGASVG
jgi:N-acetylglucosaminyl-diphospho-decaprenol L-rhamnosyltransferase